MRQVCICPRQTLPGISFWLLGWQNSQGWSWLFSVPSHPPVALFSIIMDKFKASVWLHNLCLYHNKHMLLGHLSLGMERWPPCSSQTTCCVLHEADGHALFLKAAQQPLSFDRMPPNGNCDRAIVTPRLLFLMLLSIISCLLVLLICPHYCCLHVPVILAGLALGLCCASRYGVLIY